MVGLIKLIKLIGVIGLIGLVKLIGFLPVLGLVELLKLMGLMGDLLYFWPKSRYVKKTFFMRTRGKTAFQGPRMAKTGCEKSF